MDSPDNCEARRQTQMFCQRSKEQMSRKSFKELSITPRTSDSEWMEHMIDAADRRQYHKRRGSTAQFTKVPLIMKYHGIKLRTNLNSKKLSQIERKIQQIDPSISKISAFVGVNVLHDHKPRRIVNRRNFPNSLLQDLFGTQIRINNEGQLIQEKYIENVGRYDQNINARINQLFMNLCSRKPVITEEQQNVEKMNFGSPRLKEKENQRLNEEYPTQNDENYGDSSLFPDEQSKFTLSQEKLTEKQKQKLISVILSSQNLNTVYDIGALVWERLPINDTQGKSPFITHETGYKYDQFSNPQAYMKTENSAAIQGNIPFKSYLLPSSNDSTASFNDI
ncbi:MAG: hypothetical protein EZS28_002860 [Streblomastix strix]|uniref:Uncharacterized protein n=1 Tax=Streblomastix strix TaxID=222440 RepID=A0A5J4X327_9EUKA|nr:MAG: hypothetical protein EZS28_002860 [Streblomastix strix]